jgi:hydroxymethylbilane synthase
MSTNKQKWVIATRNSPLALTQSNFVKQRILEKYPHVTIEFLCLTTEGDKNTAQPLLELGGKSLFVKELQNALLNGSADMAVHSLKDMSVFSCAGLQFAAILAREDARDAFISNHFSSFSELPANSIVGTSSPRRVSQLKFLRPDLQFTFLRGNVGTRLNKLDNDEYAAIILAAAGLIRLNKAGRIQEFFDPQQIIPAIGQGALAIECRENDVETLELTAHLQDIETTLCTTAERAVNQQLGGDCHTPIGAHAWIDAQQILHVQAIVGNLAGSKQLKSYRSGLPEQANELGTAAGEDLLMQGAEKLITT